MKNQLTKYINKIISTKDGLRGKCIGILPKSGELVVIYGKGGRVAYAKEADMGGGEVHGQAH